MFVPQTPAEHLLCVGPSPRLWGYSLSDQTTGLCSWRKADKKQVSRLLCQHRCRGEKYNREPGYRRNSGVGVAFYIGWSRKSSLGKLAVRGGGMWVSRSQGVASWAMRGSSGLTGWACPVPHFFLSFLYLGGPGGQGQGWMGLRPGLLPLNTHCPQHLLFPTGPWNGGATCDAHTPGECPCLSFLACLHPQPSAFQP